VTERKIEALVHDVLIASESLERNLQAYRETQAGFSRLHDEMVSFLQLVEEIAAAHDEIREREAAKFSEVIERQVRSYKRALKHVDIDTTQIEERLDRTHRSILSMVEKIDRSAEAIAETVEENGEAVIAAAEKIERRKGDLLWRSLFFVTGMVIGGLLLASYPIASAAEHFHDELLARDKRIQRLKKRYEANDAALKFLRRYDITMGYTLTDDSWRKPSRRFAPMILFPNDRVQLVDEIGDSRRIVFTKHEKGE